MNETPSKTDDLVPLAEVAAELHTTTQRLSALARAGKFPALLKVTRKHYLVRRADAEAWKAGRWTQTVTADAEAKASAKPGKKQRRKATR